MCALAGRERRAESSRSKKSNRARIFHSQLPIELTFEMIKAAFKDAGSFVYKFMSFSAGSARHIEHLNDDVWLVLQR